MRLKGIGEMALYSCYMVAGASASPNNKGILADMLNHAEARGLPFLDIAGRMLVRRAIRNARKSDG